MENSVLQLIFDWVQKGYSIGGLTEKAIYDILKHGSKSLLNKIKRFFKSEEESENFLKIIQSKKANSQISLEDQIGIIFNEVCNRVSSPQNNIELLNEIKEWLVTTATSQVFTNNNVKIHQKAGRDIINVQGTVNINKNHGD